MIQVCLSASFCRREILNHLYVVGYDRDPVQRTKFVDHRFRGVNAGLNERKLAAAVIND